MSQFNVDVAVIGGGPAGVSNALALTKGGLSVAIVERADHSEWRPGEVLSAEASSLLMTLGVDVAKVIPKISKRACQSIKTEWGSSELREKHSIFNPHGNGWFIDRSEFDAALAIEAESARVKIFQKTHFVTSLKNSDRWDLVLENGNRIQLSAKFLVDATGRAGSVARSLGSKLLVYDDLISIIGIFGWNAHANDSSLIIEAAEDGWWYFVPLPDRKVLAAFMTDVDIFRNAGQRTAAYWSAMVKDTRHFASLMGEISQKIKIEVRNSRIARVDPFFGKQWIAIGDAAFSFDPLTGDGIVRAIQSGIESADLILNGADSKKNFDRYYDRLVAGFNSYLTIRRDYYSVEQRWNSSLFWTRRQLALNLEMMSSV